MRTINLQGHQTLPPDMFLLNPDNAAFLRGSSRRLNRADRSGPLFLLIVALFFAILPAFWAYELNQWAQLAYRGRETEAVITGRPKSTGKSTTYYAAYQYDVPVPGGVLRVNGRAQVPYEIYSKIEKGTRMKVRYLPDSPTTSGLMWTTWPPFAKMLYLLGGLAIVLFLAVKSIRDFLSLRQLQQVGQLLPGRLVAVELEPSKGKYWLNVGYQFTTPDQQVLYGEESAVRNDLKDQPPAIGTPVAVIYSSPDTFQLL